MRRVEGHELADAIQVTDAKLVNAAIIAPETEDLWAPRPVHLDVRITSQENWRIFDYRENMALPPFDGQTRTQTSTWRFEGRIRPPPCVEGTPKPAPVEAADPASSSEPEHDDHDEPGWTVYAIV